MLRVQWEICREQSKAMAAISIMLIQCFPLGKHILKHSFAVTNVLHTKTSKNKISFKCFCMLHTLFLYKINQAVLTPLHRKARRNRIGRGETQTVMRLEKILTTQSRGLRQRGKVTEFYLSQNGQALVHMLFLVITQRPHLERVWP